jgi:hypothetical protein
MWANLQDKLHEAIVNLSEGRVESNVRLSPEHHSSSDGEEIILIEKIALEDEGVKSEIAKLQLPPGIVVISDPWIYGNGPVSACLLDVDLRTEQVRTESTMNAVSFSVSYTQGIRRKQTLITMRSPSPFLPLSTFKQKK